MSDTLDSTFFIFFQYLFFYTIILNTFNIFNLQKNYISSRKNIFWPEWILKNGDSEKITCPGNITLTLSVFFSVLTDWIFLLKFNQRLLFQSHKKIKLPRLAKFYFVSTWNLFLASILGTQYIEFCWCTSCPITFWVLLESN